MKTITNCRIEFCLVALTVLGLVLPLTAGEKTVASDLRAHEWGTFTTLHRPSGLGLGWYQQARVFGRALQPDAQTAGSVSDLPSFVQGNLALKIGGNASARMETPVIYFYTDKQQTVDVTVNYKGGRITEFYPGTGPIFRQWRNLELIPPAQAVDLIDQLPTDPKRPGNHYFEARAVPEAALVRQVQPADKEGKRKPDQLEKFVFYRGVGSFATGLDTQMKPGGIMSVMHYNADYGMKHVWVLQSSSTAVRWKKLPAFPPYDRKANSPRAEVRFDSLDAGTSREASVSALEESMVTALIDAGLTSAEAAAMVATWDQQWYQEPGQRVFSIAPQVVIDSLLPLEISPKPAETVRVFVHRAEVLSPETEKNLEVAMAPGTNPDQAREMIENAQLGRFVHGVIESVANVVGRRTTAAYRVRGLKALVKDESNHVAQAAARR